MSPFEKWWVSYGRVTIHLKVTMDKPPWEIAQIGKYLCPVLGKGFI